MLHGSVRFQREMGIVVCETTASSAAFDAIVKGEAISHTGTPASFAVLTNQIRGLALDIEPLNLPPEPDA